jgi:hypothetical protein
VEQFREVDARGVVDVSASLSYIGVELPRYRHKRKTQRTSTFFRYSFAGRVKAGHKTLATAPSVDQEQEAVRAKI